MSESSEKPLIIYAEDSKSISSVIKHTLESAGFKVIHFDTGELVVQEIVKLKPNLILLDNDMTVKDGFSIVKVKAIPLVKDIPMIFFTTVNEKQKIIERLGSGAADYVVKDSKTISEIVPRIKRLLH